MKAGTSWLYHNIQHHPNVQMPPYKEIFYFHNMSSWPLITWLITEKNAARRRRVWRVVTHYMPRRKKHIRWFLRYLLLPRTDEWYASLFSRDQEKISGDVTPTYARLKRGRVAKVHDLMPNAKILYLVRNPIKRTWSQVAMHFENWRQGLEDADAEAIQDFLGRLERKGGFKDSNYLRTLRIWGSFYPEDQIHVIFLEKLAQEPESFLQEIHQILDLSTSESLVPEEVQKKRNARQYPAMPDHFGRYLAHHMYDDIKEIYRQFDNVYTANWLEFAEEYL
jgi:hypothetical protein